MVFYLTTAAKEWLDELDNHFIQKKEDIKRLKEQEEEKRAALKAAAQAKEVSLSSRMIIDRRCRHWLTCSAL